MNNDNPPAVWNQERIVSPNSFCLESMSSETCVNIKKRCPRFYVCKKTNKFYANELIMINYITIGTNYSPIRHGDNPVKYTHVHASYPCGTETGMVFLPIEFFTDDCIPLSCLRFYIKYITRVLLSRLAKLLRLDRII